MAIPSPSSTPTPSSPPPPKPSAPSRSQVSSSSHRLPAQSASELLKELEENRKVILSTGLSSLDRLLAGNTDIGPVGWERGKVTEIWGPSGAGKTILAVQAANNAICSSHNVLWIDGAALLSAPNIDRLRNASINSSRQHGSQSGGTSQLLTHVPCPTLSHLLAFILHPPPSMPLHSTSLLVIDGLNALLDRDYPRVSLIASNRSDQQKWHAGRRYAILGALVSGLNRLATIHDLAVVVTTGCSTRMRYDSGRGAAVAPGVGGTEWEAGIWCRVVAFRDLAAARFVGMQKRQGRSLQPTDPVGGIGEVVPFVIGSDGTISEVSEPRVSDPQQAAIGMHASSSPMNARKRVYDEIADSDDEEVDEYGWEEADEVAIVAVHAAEDEQANSAPPDCD